MNPSVGVFHDHYQGISVDLLPSPPTGLWQQLTHGGQGKAMDTLVLPNSKGTTNRVVHDTKGGGDHANQLGPLIGQVPHLWAT